MWIVKNLLRGTLRFPGLEVSIPPRQEFDLDTIGRRRAETSNQLLVAFEEGYLQNVFKDSSQGPSSAEGETFRDRLEAFKEEILKELRTALPQEMGDLKLSDLKSALVDMREASLSDAEVKARLAFLEEKEQELQKNFEAIGHTTEGESDENDIMGKADLLSSI
jgi:hypothetical protein